MEVLELGAWLNDMGIYRWEADRGDKRLGMNYQINPQSGVNSLLWENTAFAPV